MKPVYVLFGIDMETDVGSFTPFYEGTKHGTPLLLELFAQKRIKGTFFFTGDCARKIPISQKWSRKAITRLVAIRCIMRL